MHGPSSVTGSFGQGWRIEHDKIKYRRRRRCDPLECVCLYALAAARAYAGHRPVKLEIAGRRAQGVRAYVQISDGTGASSGRIHREGPGKAKEIQTTPPRSQRFYPAAI